MMMATNPPLRSPERTPDQPSREVLGLGGGSVSYNAMISSLWFFLIETQYMEVELESETQQEAHEVGGRALGGGAPHPREKGVGPLVFIFGEDFLLFIVRYSMEFQVIPRTFVFCT